MHLSNSLSHCLSPYLQQHSHNPIHWQPWSDDAFQIAQELDKPIFLSIGYASCHWCHVMAQESFEDETVAAILNQHFVSIKVDREERPDLDELYMTAVQLATGRGGWPMTLFLMPNRVPFFAGTYFPKESRQGSPGFLDLCQQIALLWTERREKLIEAADQFQESLVRATQIRVPDQVPPMSIEAVKACLGELWSKFDQEHGGFGGAPKFPPHSALRLCAEPWLADTDAPTMLVKTLDSMIQGGMHDVVGGGFHRYSTDGAWHLPHFEKMLADNAQILGVLSAPGAPTGPKMNWIWAANRLVEWLQRDLLLTNGMFASSMDADSGHEEGKYYVWSAEEVKSILGERAAAFGEHYAILDQGNFLDEATQELTGFNVLHGSNCDHQAFESELNALHDARFHRQRPEIDQKAVAAWNGLMIEGLCKANEIDLALGCALAWRDAFTECGYLPHMVTDGQPSAPGFLDDSVWMALGVLELRDSLAARGMDALAVGDFARDLVDEILREFVDANQPLPRYRRRGHDEIFAEVRPVFDQVLPSPMSGLIEVLRRSGKVAEASALADTMWRFAASVPTASEGALWSIGRLLLENDSAATPLHAIRTAPDQWTVEIPFVEAAEVHARIVQADGSVLSATFSGGTTIEWSSEQAPASIQIQVCRDQLCEPWRSFAVSENQRTGAER